MREVFVIGVGQTDWRPRDERALQEVIFEATSAALDDAGISIAEVDSVVTAASDELDGRPITSMLTCYAAGAHLKDEMRLTDEGLFAAVMAYLRVASGDFACSLAVSWSKTSEVPWALIGGLAAEPFYSRPLGLNHEVALALRAGRYLAEHGPAERARAAVVVKNRLAGMRNPKAQGSRPPLEAEILSSPYACWPLRRAEIPEPRDGAVAVVLAADPLASGRAPAVGVRGLGWAAGTSLLGEARLDRLEVLERAAQSAYRMAGLDRPAEEVEVVELSDATSVHELMAYEALGLCGRGEASRLAMAALANHTRPAINPSGGSLGSGTTFAAGLRALCEAVLQVRGDAGERQILGARRALAHGSAGESHAVVLVERAR